MAVSRKKVVNVGNNTTNITASNIENNTTSDLSVKNSQTRNENPLRKRKVRVFVASGCFLGVFLLIILIIPAIDRSSRRSAVEKYMSATSADSDVLNGFIDNEAFDDSQEKYYVYADNMLGIDNNVALAGRSVNTESNTNYYNSYNGQEAFLEGQSLKYMKDGASNEISSNADEPILTAGALFYIDNDNSSALVRYDTNTGSSDTIYNNVHQYALYGDYVVVLNDTSELYRIKVDSKESLLLADNIQRFFAEGKIIAQNGNRIITISLDGYRFEELLKDAILEGYSKGKIYFTYIDNDENEDLNNDPENSAGSEIVSLKDGRYAVYEYNMATGNIRLVQEYPSMIRAVYVIDNKISVDTI